MTRIALIAGTYQPEHCGVAHYTACLRSALNQRHIQSLVLTTDAAALAADDASVLGVTQDWRLADLLPLIRAVHRSNIDLLHIQHAAGTYGFQRAIFLLPLLLRVSGWRRPIITTVHEYGWWEWQPQAIPPWLVEGLKQWGQRRGWWDREDGCFLTLSDALITTNSAAAAVIRTRLPQRQLYRIPIAANIKVVAIDPAVARQQLRLTCGWSQETMIIAFFGFLHPVKGLETLLPAFKQVLRADAQARLLLVGGVESLALPGAAATRYWNQLQARVVALGLQEQVHLSGYLSADRASEFLAGANIGVLPFNSGVTLKSGSLLTLLAHGLPVVATRHDPPDPDLQSPIQLVEPRDQEGLAIALVNLLTNPLQRSELAVASRTFAHSFTWSSIAQRHLELYQTLLVHPVAAAAKPITF